jgi:hypothetical protein
MTSETSSSPSPTAVDPPHHVPASAVFPELMPAKRKEKEIHIDTSEETDGKGLEVCSICAEYFPWQSLTCMI